MQSQKAIQTRFAQKSDTYRYFAKAQLEAAKKLIAIQNSQIPSIKGSWLDIGSGPSILSQIPDASPVIQRAINLDISIDSLLQPKIGINPRAIVADMDALPLREKCLDGVISSSALQWSQDLQVLLKTLERSLKEDGYALFSVLGSDTLSELRELQKEFGISTYTSYYTADEFRQRAEEAGFTSIFSSSQKVSIPYKSSKEALFSISRIGASAHRNTLLSPREIGRFRKAYSERFDNNTIIHTYEYHYFLLRKQQS